MYSCFHNVWFYGAHHSNYLLSIENFQIYKSLMNRKSNASLYAQLTERHHGLWHSDLFLRSTAGHGLLPAVRYKFKKLSDLTMSLWQHVKGSTSENWSSYVPQISCDEQASHLTGNRQVTATHNLPPFPFSLFPFSKTKAWSQVTSQADS